LSHVRGRVLDSDDRGGGVALDEQCDQLAIAVGTVGEQQRVDQPAALVQQRTTCSSSIYTPLLTT